MRLKEQQCIPLVILISEKMAGETMRFSNAQIDVLNGGESSSRIQIVIDFRADVMGY